MAMVLAMVGVAIALVLGMSFLNAQATGSEMSQTVVNASRSRGTAESGIAMAIAYINQDADWRTNQSSGVWVGSHAFAGGTIEIRGVDEVDGDLADAPGDDAPVAL